MDELFERRLLRRLDPDAVVANLTRVGVALTLYELLKVQVFNVVGFISMGQKHFENDGITHKSNFKDCISWLIDEHAVSDDEAATIDAVRAYRNQLAHESTSLIIDPSVEIRDELIDQGAQIHRKLELYWKKLWASLDPMLEGREVHSGDISLPASSLLDHVISTTRSARPE